MSKQFKITKLDVVAEDLRARAEEVLAQADTMQSPDAKAKMQRLAASYNKLAEFLESQPSGTLACPKSAGE